MDNTSIIPSSNIQSNNIFTDPKNIAILILAIIVFLSLLGINILAIVGNFIQNISNIFAPLIQKILGFLGYTTGAVIDKTTDIAGNTAKLAVDIAEGTLDEVGGLLMDASKDKVNTKYRRNIDKVLQTKPRDQLPEEPSPTPSESPIQKPIKSNGQWCLVGEYKEKRGCIEVGEHDKCLSGQVFPTQKACLNPNVGPSA
jgi:hypothetical protein